MEFVPSVYEHCAALIGRRPWEVSRDPELMFRGQAEAYRLYQHAPVVVGVDIYNLEAEAYGAAVAEPLGNGIPAVTQHPCATLEEILALPSPDPISAGRLPMIIGVGRRLKNTFPGADVRIPVSGPFSLATSLLGLDSLLCEACLQPERTTAMLLHLVEGQMAFCRAIRSAGLDIAFFESAAAPPLLSPELFHRVELPALQTAMQRAAAIVHHPVPCIIGGDTARITDHLLATGTLYVICPSPHETDQAAFLRGLRPHPHVKVRVNMAPEIVARGPLETLKGEADRILALIRDRPGACVGTGALPYETPPEHVLFLQKYIGAA
ncbi:MAG: hypothetical protein JXR77_07535 [Lentisphaeria bacterium]|nr:hypothetical protein [Lentisphaeria bacterium]